MVVVEQLQLLQAIKLADLAVVVKVALVATAHTQALATLMDMATGRGGAIVVQIAMSSMVVLTVDRCLQARLNVVINIKALITNMAAPVLVVIN